MSKLFRGQVKISDVQEALNEIVDRVNNIIDEYNTQIYVNNIDYTSGSASLSPAGYTLSVGGLKKVIQNMDECVIGAKPFIISDNKIKMSTGLLMYNGSVYRLPDSLVNINSNTKHIYFNPDSNTYSTVTGVKVCDLNIHRDSKLVSDNSDIQCEDLSTSYKIKSQTKDYTTGHKFINWGGGFYENLNTSSNPKFVSAINSLDPNGCQIRLFNTVVDEYAENGDRANQVWSPMVYLFIPKGVSNPYTYYQRGNQVNVNKTNQKVLDVTIDKS